MDSVTTAFELMELELNNAVEDLNTEGARLFRSSAYAEAERLTVKGRALDDFRNRVKALSSEWATSFASQVEVGSREGASDEAARKILSTTKAAKTGLMVRFSDSTLVCENTASGTLVSAIKKIGFERVEAIGLHVNGENIVSRQKSRKYQDVHVPPFYVKTHSNTEQKKKNLERIAEALGLRLVISIVD